MTKRNEPTPEQPDYEAPGKSGHSGPHGGQRGPDDAPGQVRKDADGNVIPDDDITNPPTPNQDLPSDQPAPNQDLP